MKKDVLFNKFNSCKKTIWIFLLAICTCSAAFAQNRQITGTVTSADDGTPIPGVSIAVKGTTIGVTTDINGAFKLSVPANATLVFTFIGYVAQEIPVGSGNVYNVKLQSTTSNLNEVVVIGYGTQKRTDLTGAISSVTSKQIEAVPVTSLDQALQGRAAGVLVTNNDASPGGNITVLVRGVGSLATNGNGPLYVVDGYPLDAGGINNINPNDIATIEVLKDASATAIYGIRGANGVVLITTKKGKKDGVQVSLDGYNAFQSKPKEYKVLNAQQFATLANTIATDPSQNFQSFAGWADPGSLHNVDWQNAVYGTGLTQDYNLAIRGGSEKVQSATSFGYYDQQGIVYRSYFKRATFSNNTDYQPVKWLRSSTSVKYTYQDGKNPIGGQLQNGGNLLQISELPPTLDGGNKFTNQIKDANGNYGFYNPIYQRISSYGNPIYSADHSTSNNLNSFLLANTSLEATIFDGFKIKTNIGINTSNFAGEGYTPQDSRVADQYPGQKVNLASYNQHVNQTFDWLMENTIAYDKTFGKHTIDFVAGASEQKTIWNGMGGSGIPPNGVIQDLSQVSSLSLDVNNPTNPDTGNGSSITSLQSYFARATYQFENRYIITGTVRRDGSSKFPTANEYGTFPSGAVKWKAKQESFLKDVSWLSDLSIRGSYGQTGNQGSIPAFQYLALYGGNLPALANNNGNGVDNYGYPFDKIYQNGIVAKQPANPNLKWETDTQADIGLDAAFLNGDLTFTADWYDRKSKDFLLTLAAPAQTGFNYLTRNVGSMDNKGLEFSANYDHTASSDFRYGIALTVATVDNKLTSITSGTNFVTNFGGLNVPADGWSTFSETNIGQPVGEFYGYKSLGVIQNQAQLDALNASAVAKHGAGSYYQKSTTVPGDRLFADVNGDGIVDANDQVSLGSPLPKFYGGLNLDATYKAWDFTAYFYGVYGNKIFDFAASALQSFQNRSFVGIENVSQDYYNNAWTPSKPSNIYSRVTANDDVEGSNVASSNWIENGSFLKLKTFTVGYTLPDAMAKKVALTKIRIYVSTQNLFTITSYKGLDPEIGIQGGNATQNGIDTGTYPSSKFYTIGLNVTL